MPSDGVFIVPSKLAIFGDFWKFCFECNFCALRFSNFLAIFGDFCFTCNYLCPPILWSLLFSGTVSCIRGGDRKNVIFLNGLKIESEHSNLL